MKKIIKLQFENTEQQELNIMSVPLLKNSRILVDFLENNQNLIAPLFRELLEEGIEDGSISNIKYTKSLSELFTLITNFSLHHQFFHALKRNY